MTFYTPEPVSMVLREAEQAGYGAMMTSNRLIMRSPYNTAETYAEDVSNYLLQCWIQCNFLYSLLQWCSIFLSLVGCWSPHGSFQGERLLQGATWSECGELSSCLSHRWVSSARFSQELQLLVVAQSNQLFFNRWRPVYWRCNLLARTSACNTPDGWQL